MGRYFLKPKIWDDTVRYFLKTFQQTKLLSEAPFPKSIQIVSSHRYGPSTSKKIEHSLLVLYLREAGSCRS